MVMVIAMPAFYVAQGEALDLPLRQSARSGSMRSYHRPSACGVVGLGLLLLVGCGSKSVTPADASSSTFLPIPSCGGTAQVIGTTSVGYFNGDSVSVTAALDSGTTVNVYLADSGSGALAIWHTTWQPADAGANLAPTQGSADVTFNFPMGTSTLITIVTGTIDVVSATNPAAVAAAGHGGQIDENVVVSTGNFSLSGSITSPYCQFTTSAITSP
jgi:hypothetical protein